MGWGLCSLFLLGALPAAAQPASRLSLTWNAPVECPTRDQVHARVDELLGGDSSASSVADVVVSGQVERMAGGFRLELSLAAGDRPTVRELEAGTCDELAGAAAIAIALLARSSAASASSTDATNSSTTAVSAPGSAPRPGSTTARERSPAANSVSPPPREASDEDGAGRSSRVHLVIDAPLGVIGWGSLPSTAIGVGAALGIRWKALRVVAGGELWRPQTLEQSGFSMRFELQSARTDVCLTQDLSSVEFGPCLGAALERLSGEGVGSSTFSAESSTAFWVSGTGGIMGAVTMPGFPTLRFHGQASVRVATRRPRFVIEQLGPVHQPAVAAPKLDFGFGWIF